MKKKKEKDQTRIGNLASGKNCVDFIYLIYHRKRDFSLNNFQTVRRGKKKNNNNQQKRDKIHKLMNSRGKNKIKTRKKKKKRKAFLLHKQISYTHTHRQVTPKLLEFFSINGSNLVKYNCMIFLSWFYQPTDFLILLFKVNFYVV